jgi:hypothetical protein
MKHSLPTRPFSILTPEDFERADAVEIRVSITPLRYDQIGNVEATGSVLYPQAAIHRLEAKDSRFMFHIVRQLIAGLVREYLGVEL